VTMRINLIPNFHCFKSALQQKW